MKIEITILVAVVGCILAILTYIAGIKKTSVADVEKRARLEGEITAKLDQLIKTVEKLDQKLTRSNGELHAEIDKKILDHERRMHNAGT